MKRRPRRGFPAALTALALLAVCTVTAVVAIQMIINEPPWFDYRTIAEAVHGTRWGDSMVVVVGGVVSALGIVLLVVAALPGRPTVLPLNSDSNGNGAGTDSGAARDSLRNTLRAAAAGVDGVASATLVLRRKKIATIVRTNRTNVAGLEEAVHAAIDRRLDQITPTTRPTIRVRVRASRSGT